MLRSKFWKGKKYADFDKVQTRYQTRYHMGYVILYMYLLKQIFFVRPEMTNQMPVRGDACILHLLMFVSGGRCL